MPAAPGRNAPPETGRRYAVLVRDYRYRRTVANQEAIQATERVPKPLVSALLGVPGVTRAWPPYVS